jgi:hypothetical protein
MWRNDGELPGPVLTDSQEKDTYIIRDTSKQESEEGRTKLSTTTTVFPGGKRVHSLDRDLYEGAYRRAMAKFKERA